VTAEDLDDAERRQLLILFVNHQNPGVSTTYSTDACRSLLEKGLAEEDDLHPFPLVKLSERGIELARGL
jgi:hypothetical protein